MPKWKPNYLLDEQMYFGDSSVTLLFQIREELRELNKNIKALNIASPVSSGKGKSSDEQKETVKGK